jgi:hypothetical protein
MILVIIGALTLSFCVAVKQLRPKSIEDVAESELFYLGDDADGESWYFVFKRESKEWVSIISPFASAIAVLTGIKLGKRKETT